MQQHASEKLGGRLGCLFFSLFGGREHAFEQVAWGEPFI